MNASDQTGSGVIVYHRFSTWLEVVNFLATHEKARLLAEPYNGGSYKDWVCFIPLEVAKNST